MAIDARAEGERPMVSRLLVPVDAQIPPKSNGGEAHSATAGRRSLLIPARLIPPDAQIAAPPFEVRSGPAAGRSPADFMVRKLLVPADARIGSASGGMGPARMVQRDLFKEALLGKAPTGHRRNPTEWLASLGVHFLVIAVVLIVPLFYTQALDVSKLEVTFLIAPEIPSAPPPLPPPMFASSMQRPRRPEFTPAQLTMPTAVPKNAPVVPSSAEPEPIAGIPGGVIGGVPGGQIGGVLGGLASGMGLGVAPPPPPPPPASAPASSEPLRIGGQVKEPRAIYRPQPEYPLLARQSRVEGVVEIDAIIDEHGNVIHMRAVSGPGLLIQAALKAASKWKYEPTYLNGEPYPVAMTIHVTFQLS